MLFMKIMQETRSYNAPNLPIIKGINKFVFSKLFVVLIALLTVLSNVFALDMYFFYSIVLFAVYIAVFGRDFSPYLPMLCCCYIVSSVSNNPGINSNSILFPKESGYIIFYLAGIVLLGMIYRFSIDSSIGFKNIFKQKRKLLIGMAILSLSYFISGIGSNGYYNFALKNLAFSGLQSLTVIVPYFILSFSVHWKDVDKDYLIFTGVCIGVAVCFELVGVYFINGVMTSGVPSKALIYTGWGISNNIGAMISMMIPFVFYYLYKNKHPIIWLLVLDFMALMTAFSCSRTSILIGLAFFIVGNAIVFIKANKLTKLLTLVNLIVFALLVYLCSWVGSKTLHVAFINGLSSKTRVELYTLGIKTFFHSPILGSGFYSLNEQIDILSSDWVWSKELSFSTFFPGRWHNTIIQLVATGGLIALLAYIFHRFQTINLFVKKRSPETFFTMLSILILLTESMFDCHFFNIGPVLFYSVALAFIEFKTPNDTNTIPFKEYIYSKKKNCLLK